MSFRAIRQPMLRDQRRPGSVVEKAAGMRDMGEREPAPGREQLCR
jgi:hypothetical protein